MMNPALIKTPTISLWKAEFDDMLSGKKSTDFNKLGGAGAYVLNILTYTSKNNENLNLSVHNFFEVFNDALNQQVKKPKADALTLEVLVELANSFTNKYELNTLNVKHLTKITTLFNTFISQQSQVELIQHEEIFDTYLHYLKMFVLPIEIFNKPDKIIDTQINLLNQKPNLVKKIESNLHNIISNFKETIGGLAVFILYLLNKYDEILPENKVLQTELIEYSIAYKTATNKLISEAILKFANENEAIFSQILEAMECRLTSDGFNILYKNGTFKQLEPNKKQWDRLNKTFKLNSRPVNEILNEHLSRQLNS